MASAVWTPQEDGLKQIIELLKESQSSDTNVQRQVQQVNQILNLRTAAKYLGLFIGHSQSQQKSCFLLFQKSVSISFIYQPRVCETVDLVCW